MRSIDTILVSPNAVTLVMGQNATLTASLRDEFGVAFSGIPVRWSSQDEAVAVVSPSGVVTALGTGSTSILAIAAVDSGNAAITVTGFPMIQLTPTSLSFNGSVGGPDPAAQSVAVSNTGDGILSGVTLGGVTYGNQPGGWLTLQLSENPLTITVRVSILGLAAGNYSAEATVEGGNASNAPVMLPVTLEVVP